MLIRSTTRNAIHKHEVTIQVVDAPVLDARAYYTPGMTYQPHTLDVEWIEGSEPRTIYIVGTSSENTEVKRGYGLKQSPEWLRQAVQESITEAKDWAWGAE